MKFVKINFISITSFILILFNNNLYCSNNFPLIKWQPAATHPKAETTYHNLILVDIDLDSNLEIVTTKHLGGIEIWHLDAKGEWSILTQTGLPKDGFYQGLAIGDVNLDGKLDIVAAPANLGISLWLGENNLKYRPILTNLPQVGSYFGLKIGDLNLDGIADIVAAHQSGIKVWLGDASGEKWTPKNYGLPNYKYYYQIDIVDFNLDGNPDIVATNNDGSGVKAWVGDGRGRWMNTSKGLASYGNYYGLTTSDVNLDGNLDIIAGSSKNGLSIWLGDGKGNWQEATQKLPQIGSFFSLKVADFNLDGKPDLAAGTDAGVKVWLGDDNGNWQLASWGLSTENVYHSLATGDVNLDGKPDLVAAGSMGIQIYLSKQAPITLLGWIGQIGYTLDGLQPEYGTLGTIFTYKVNYINANNLPPKKGYPRVGISRGQTHLGTYTMRESQKEDTTFTDGKFYYLSTRLTEIGNYTYQFEAEDIAGNRSMGTPIYPQIGPTISSKPIHPHLWVQKTILKTSQEHYGIAIADFNLDGEVDVVCATPKGVKAWIRTKENTWQSASFRLNENKFYYGVALVDFNLDGKLDIVATSLNGIDAWLGDGDGRWSVASNGLKSTGFFYGLSCGDVNFDGYPDIVAGTNDNRGIMAWLGDGKGNWTSASKGLPTEGHLCSVALVDFNLDGTLDIVAGDYTGIMFLLEENTIKFDTYSQIPLPTTPSFQLAGLPDILFGRFDGITKGFAGDGKGNWSYSFTNLSLGDGLESEFE